MLGSHIFIFLYLLTFLIIIKLYQKCGSNLKKFPYFYIYIHSISFPGNNTFAGRKCENVGQI